MPKRGTSDGGSEVGGKKSKPSSLPAPDGEDVPPPSDPHVELLRTKQVWQIAYMRDVTRVVHHSIEGRGLAENVTMVGRAYTCEGPDIYLNALECIQPGEVFVHGGCNDTDAVFSPGWTHAYLKPRGAVGVVVDGGVYKSYQCKDAAVPMFTKFVSPSPAINRKETVTVGKSVVIGGVTISPGDIVMGDKDGVIVIPKECEDDLFDGLDGFLEANGMFGKIAALALKAGIPLTEEPALAGMFARKYAHPENYWRQYAGWWAEWKDKYPHIKEDSEGTKAFYSGK